MNPMAKILVVDDDLLLCDMVEMKLSKLGLSSRAVLNLSEAYKAIREEPYDIVLLDVNLPDGNGIEALQDFKQSVSHPEVIIITGIGDPKGAELALVTGAWDYIAKPISTRDLELQVKRALDYRKEKASTRKVTLLERAEIIGDDPAIKSCLEKVAISAMAEQSVLITGQTGTGKELFARAIHVNSHRAQGPFVVLDCAAFPEQLVESVLFGHQKGSFTGADTSREGLLLQADRGTLFMDEVGELPLEMQKSFLRVLQEKTFRPIGGHREVKSDFRVIAATNRDLESMVDKGSFREDLLFRLAASTIHLPSLKERESDIESLAFHYMRTTCKLYSVPIKGISEQFLQILRQYSWPGNIRELVNSIEYAVTNSQNQGVLLPIHLPVKLRVMVTKNKLEQMGTAPRSGELLKSNGLASMPTLKESLEETEKKYIQTLIQLTSGDVQQICHVSGLSRTVFYGRLKKYNITRPS